MISESRAGLEFRERSKRIGCAFR